MPTPNPLSRSQALVRVVLAYLCALVVGGGVGWMLRDHHPIVVAAAADLAGTVVVFAFSAVYNNSSFYDPYWSVAPLPLALYWASGSMGLRQLLILFLIALWGVRLTGNWVARWRGINDEDFRYVEIRGRTGRLYWPASFVSIHLMPTIWVFLGLLPIFPALAQSKPVAWLDIAALFLTAGAIAIEAMADWQLRGFLRTRRNPEDVLHQGLWAFCRHPNYLGEILFWWGLFLFGLAAAPSWAWSVVGPISITLLFALVSVPWMDRRLVQRHPDWVKHMQSCPSLLPWPRRDKRK